MSDRACLSFFLACAMSTAATMALPVSAVTTRAPEPLIVDPTADVLIVGDSIAAGMATVGESSWPAYGDSVQNLAVQGSRTSDILRTVFALEGARPSLLVVMVGTNNLRTDGVEEIADDVVTIAREAHRYLPDTNVMVVGILPRAQTGLRKKAEAVNFIVRHRAREMDALFVEVDLPITPDVLPDSLHPSAYGYDLIAEQLSPWVNP